MHDRRLRLLAWVAAMPLCVSAAPLVYDGVPTSGVGAYTVGSNLGGQYPAHATILGEKATTAWVPGTSAIRPVSGGLAYPAGISLSTQPGAVRLLQAATTGVGTRSSYCTLTTPMAQSFYFSVLGAVSALPYYTNGQYGVVGLCNASTGNTVPPETSACYVGFRKNGNPGAPVQTIDAILKVNATIHVLATDVAAGTYYFTLKFTHNASGPDTVSASVVTTPDEPAPWAATVTTSVIDGATTFKYVAVGGFWQTWNGIDFDEWRVGTTYADVAGAAGGAPSFAGLATVTNVTSSGATLQVPLNKAGSPAATMYAYWGTSDGLFSVDSWQHGASFGTAPGDGATVSFSAFSPALDENTFYYYRLAASNATDTAWSLCNPNYFMTAPVTVTAPAGAPENSVTPILFTLQRPSAATALALSVPYTIGGTAQPGVHFVNNPSGIATIPAGQSSTTVPITPLADWESALERTVTLNLQPGPYVSAVPASATVTLLNAVLPMAPTNAWIGRVSTLASVATNWSLGLPTSSHDILVTPAYSRRNLDWDAAAPTAVASWTQPAGCTNTVTFHTTAATPLAVLHDVTLQAGAWTHAGPAATPVAAVAVTAGGSFLLAAGATINVTSKGHLNGAGPGYLLNSGSAFAGEGWLGGNCYGSALDPLAHGSGSRGSGADAAKYSGGGLVVLRIDGAATLNGSIAANGFGYNSNGGGSSGGTINLTAASFAGTGTLSATGGGDTYAGAGAGGRIRLRLTQATSFAGFGAGVLANGEDGDPIRGTGGSASGTICFQTAGDSLQSGRILVTNTTRSRDATNGVLRATHLTPIGGPAEDLRLTSWELQGNARLRLTAHARVKSLAITKTDAADVPRLLLDGYTLSVRALNVRGTAYPPGTYTAADLASTSVLGAGRIVVESLGSLITLR